MQVIRCASPILFLFLLLLGCAKEGAPAYLDAAAAFQSDAHAAEKETSEQESTNSAPRLSLFAGTVDRGLSWGAGGGSAERRYLYKVYHRYHLAAQFNSPAERVLAQKQGVPMPEEWLTARAMHTDDLKRMADGGNPKAQLFYADRLFEELETARQRVGADSIPEMMASVAAGDEHYNRYNTLMTYTFNLLNDRDDAFAAYMYGTITGTITGQTSLIPASMLLADDRGDTRAAPLLKSYLAENPDQDTFRVLRSYQQMLKRNDRRAR